MENKAYAGTSTYPNLEQVAFTLFLQRFEEAEQQLGDFLTQMDVKSSPEYFHLVLRYIELGIRLERPKQLMAEFFEDLHTNRHLSLEQRDLCQICLGLLSEGLSPTQIITNLSPYSKTLGNNPLFKYCMAMVCFKLELFEKAVQNYTECLSLDKGWYLALFGISQCYYKLGKKAQADQFFSSFEQQAPLELYGSVETHRHVAYACIENDDPAGAHLSMELLFEWWSTKKNECPIEVQVIYHLVKCDIFEYEGNQDQQSSYHNLIQTIVRSHLKENSQTNQEKAYLIGKILIPYQQTQLTLECFEHVLCSEHSNEPSHSSEILSQMMSWKNLSEARALVERAWHKGVRTEEVSDCLLWIDLRDKNIQIGEYFELRNQYISTLKDPSKLEEAVFLYAKLSSLYRNDLEIEIYMIGVFIQLDLKEKAELLATKLSKQKFITDAQILNLIEYLIVLKNKELCQNLTQKIDQQQLTGSSKQAFQKICSEMHEMNGDLKSAIQSIEQAYLNDIWDVDIILQYESLSFRSTYGVTTSCGSTINFDYASSKEWEQYLKLALEEVKPNQVGIWQYLRVQLYLLKFGLNPTTVDIYLKVSHLHENTESTQHLIYLLNTNFDSAWLYWAIGKCAKNSWQLQSSTTWFEMALKRDDCDHLLSQKITIELADTNTILGQNVTKSVLLLSSLHEEGRLSGDWYPTLAQAYLAQGNIHKSRDILDGLESEQQDNFEVSYVRGLIHFQSGDHRQARKFWKPLIKQATPDMRSHFMKQKMLQFYFHSKDKS